MALKLLIGAVVFGLAGAFADCNDGSVAAALACSETRDNITSILYFACMLLLLGAFMHATYPETECEDR